MASHETVNYVLRPNKNVERKLFVEMFRRLGHMLDLATYRYVGLGGLWFADFILVHRRLGITDLVSIEKNAPDRAAFNRPFDCVRVEAGNSTEVLPELDLARGPAIVWMDHDSDLRGPALKDIEVLTDLAAPDSLLFITVNAHVRQIKGEKDPNNEKLKPLVALEHHVGSLVPVGVTSADLSMVKFPQVVSRVLINAFEHGVRQSGRPIDFELLVNLHYRDGTPMVTVGGRLKDRSSDPLDWTTLGPLPFWPPSEEPFTIDVPLLTMREKAALDQMMPPAEPLQSDEVRVQLGIELRQEKLNAFERFYREYPVFAEYEL